MKQKLEEKNEADKHMKKKKAYITWEENDSSTSSESDDSTKEENNLCLMAGTRSSKTSVSSFKFEHEQNNYYELLDAFNELHKEATKLQKSNSKRKGEIKWLEGRVKQLEEENENLIACLEKLEKSEKYLRSRCEHCPGQLEKIEYLMKTFSKFTLGKSNLDVVLGSQRSVLNKEGIGYNGDSNRLGPRNFLNISKPSSIICTYCYELGHFSNSCYFKNNGVPKEKFKWVPKGTAKQSNTRGPKFTWVPASSK